MLLAIVIATIAGFVLSATYYSLVPDVSTDDDPASEPSPLLLALVELARSAAIVGLMAGLLSVANWTTPIEGALLGAGLWTLPVVLLVGSIVHEGTRARSAALHAGDWLIKLLAVGTIIGWLS